VATNRVWLGLSPCPISADDYAMMPPRPVTTGLPRDHERVRAATPAATQRSRQGRRYPHLAAPDRLATAPTRRPAHPVPARQPGPAGPHYCTRSPGPLRSDYGCWRARTRSCAGTATCSPAAVPDPADTADHPRCARSAPWHYGWPARTAAGATGASTTNCSPSESSSPPPRSGRSCARPVSIPRRTGPPPPGPTSSARKPRRCWPPTSSKR
jgi:hypothetical protein